LFLQFLLEAVVLSVVGGLPGIALGTGVTLFPEGTFPYVPRLSAVDFVLALSFIAAAGLVSGIFPAMRAANMEPVDALRY
jgi:putative ABC transport system permease protein